MKDPLHIEKTPYDILEIPETADKSAIETGYKNAVMRKNIDAAAARRTLLDPLDRALEDIFLYRNDYLNMLDINENDPEQLRYNRLVIYRKWSELNKKNFPEIGPQTFCTAVLLYWWAINEEECYWSMRSGSRDRQVILGSPSIDALWQLNIAYWVSIINSEHAILAWLNNKNYYNTTFSTAKAKEFCPKIKTHFSRIFDKYMQKCQEAGDRERMEIYRSLELSFNTDLDTASKIREIGFKKEVNGRSFPIYCGKLMLQEAEQLSYIRTQLDSLKQSYIKDERIIKIIDNVAVSLSEYHFITLMINNKDYEGALKAIDSLSIFERSRPEVINIHATALFEKGKNLLESDMTDEALGLWKELQRIEKLSPEYSAEIGKVTRSKAADLLQRSPEAAITLINESLKLVGSDKELEDLLALAFSRQGMQRLENAIRSFEKDNNIEKVKRGIDAAIKDLERSASLNPSDSNTSENLKMAKGYLSAISGSTIQINNNISESLRLNNEGIRLLNEAQELSKRGQSELAGNNASQAIEMFIQANNLNPADKVIEKNISIARDWYNIYDRENNQKFRRQNSAKGKPTYAGTFFVLAIIAYLLLYFLDKKII